MYRRARTIRQEMSRIGLPAFVLSGVRCDHQQGIGRPRTASEVQTRLRFDRPVPRQRPRDPVGEFLRVGPHATGLSFTGRVHHVPHRQHLHRSPDAPRRPLEDYTSISGHHHPAFPNCRRTVTRTGRGADVNPGGSLGRCSKRPSAARVVCGWLDAAEFAGPSGPAPRALGNKARRQGRRLDGAGH
jgi:hypothetical protein